MEYNVKLGYCLTRDVKDPAYGNSNAGCIDFFIPTFDAQFIKDLGVKNPRFSASNLEGISSNKEIVINPGQDICIPSGVHARLAKHTALTAFNKSGVATKLKMVRGAEYVDCDYMGEIHLHLINAGDKQVVLEEGQKIIQFSYVPVLTAIMSKSENKDSLYEGFTSERGEGWQGSTGTK